MYLRIRTSPFSQIRSMTRSIRGIALPPTNGTTEPAPNSSQPPEFPPTKPTTLSRPSTTRPTRILYWHRTDLRLTDSPALTAALLLQGISVFYPVWCFDPNYVYGHRVGLNRWSFLLSSMSDLSAYYTSLNPQQMLHVVRGPPEEVLPIMWKEWGITHLVYEKDSNAYARVRDKKVVALAQGAGVEVVGVHGRHLFDPEVVVRTNGGKGTMTLHQWQNVGPPPPPFTLLAQDNGVGGGSGMADAVGWQVTKKIGNVQEIFPTPTSIPDPGETGLPEREGRYRWEGVDMNQHLRNGEDTCFGRFAAVSHSCFYSLDSRALS